MTKFGGSVLVPEGTTAHITKPPILKSLRTVAFLSASNLDSQMLLSSPKPVPSVQPQQRQAEARTALTEEFSCQCLSGHMGLHFLCPSAGRSTVQKDLRHGWVCDSSFYLCYSY